MWRIPGPLYLLFEAFSKSGWAVRAGDIEEKNVGFVFLTDGGHIDNLAIYELLRRRCRLIISIDAEADPDFTGASLVQVERFARIDLKGTSNNVRGHKFGLGLIVHCLPGFFFRPLLRLTAAGTTPTSSCRGEPFQRHQAADVPGQVLQADLGAPPHDSNRSHDPHRPAHSACARTHARCQRVSGSWRRSLAFALKTADNCARPRRQIRLL